jgi:hypothetical protein
MGLAFLPWERLPAYVFGPLFCALNAWLLYVDTPRSWRSAGEVACLAFGVWVIWSRYKTGEEPLWSEEQRATARRRRSGHE